MSELIRALVQKNPHTKFDGRSSIRWTVIVKIASVRRLTNKKLDSDKQTDRQTLMSVLIQALVQKNAHTKFDGRMSIRLRVIAKNASVRRPTDQN